MDKRLVRSLLKPAAYDEPTATVRLLQTHVSYLFITDHHVYKVKKPVNLGFLNFTTLDRRRFFCDEEVRLNRRLCPDIYLGVLEVRETGSGANVRGEGTIVDYAVKMKRLPEDRMLDRLLADGKVGAAEVRRVARRIAAFHLESERGGEIDAYGSVETIRHNWEENFQQVGEFLRVTIDEEKLRLIRAWVTRFLAVNGELFAARVAGGFIRDCDGDLHAENICIRYDDVCIFDCIEFNSRFRYSDTAADLAFLLMDLDFHGRPQLAEVLLDEYRAATEDRDVALLTDFYKVYRAFVRGKVESFRLRDPRMSGEEKQVACEKARRYFALARGYCLRERFPLTLIITSGLMGSGKSTVAGRLALELGLEHLSSDRVRKELAGVGEGEHSFDPYGTGLYTEERTAATYGALFDRCEALLRQGRSVVVDATFRRASDRLRFRTLAERLNIPFVIIVVTCPEAAARQRLGERVLRHGEVSDGRRELYARQQEESETVSEGEGNRIFVDTSRPIDDTINGIFREMGLV
jgi:aminoglycoside phosphotransferase family enzyme/predicted kinase